MTETCEQTCKRILYGHLVNRKLPLFVATLLAMGLASLPLAAPDINSAAGQGQIVEVTNNHYTCFDTTGTVLQDTPMSVFFNYTGQLLTDPRVVYDHVWNRWIVTQVAFAQSPTVQFFFLAASTS